MTEYRTDEIILDHTTDVDPLAQIEHDPERLGHIHPDGHVVEMARLHQFPIRGLCGFRRIPLPVAQIDGIEVCVVCSAVRGIVADARRDWGIV